MNITVANNDRFPYIYGLEKLGGEKNVDGEKYYEDHEKELSKEYDEIMNVWMHRYKLGDNKKIHIIPDIYIKIQYETFIK